MVLKGSISTMRFVLILLTPGVLLTVFPDMVVALVEVEQTGDRVDFHSHWTVTNNSGRTLTGLPTVAYTENYKLYPRLAKL